MNGVSIHRCTQFSDEWKQLHHGIPTAGNFHKILTPTGRKSEQRKGYLFRLVAERLLNEFLPMRVSADKNLYWADRGLEMEPIAIKAFEKENNVQVERIGFVTSPHGRLGCSPEGLIVGKNECVEIKSPAPWTQIEYLLEGPGTDYRPQVQGQMLVGHFDCNHFYAFHPRMPRKYVLTLPDPGYMATLTQALEDFLGELDEQTQKARELVVYIRAEEILNLRE